MNPLAAVFGVDLEDAADPERIWSAIGSAESRGGDERFAAAATRELLRLAGARMPSGSDVALTTLWPGVRSRRRAWRVLRTHLTLPRLALPEVVRALALAPSLVAGAWLVADMRPDLGGAIFAWAPLTLINLMLVTVVERAVGWRTPVGARLVADLERRLCESPHDHPWTIASVRARVAEPITVVAQSS